MTVETVLVGTTLETASDPVVRTGAELARRCEARLHLFHAYSLPVAYFAGPTGMTAIPPDLLESERQLHRRKLEAQLARLGIDRDDLAGVTVEPGAAHRMLLDTAEEVAADLIAVGSSETPGRVLHGTTTDRVLRKATCPVWIVAGATEMPPQRIVAPVDLSPLSEECLLRGLALATRISAASPPSIEALFVLTEEERESSAQFTADQIERLAHEEIGRFVEHLDPGGDRGVRRKVRIGEIREEILREIESSSADLLILGTHGRSGFERFLLGSVASDMASRAPCDVLIIPPQQAAVKQ